MKCLVVGAGAQGAGAAARLGGPAGADAYL
jgi:hypothetical protein